MKYSELTWRLRRHDFRRLREGKRHEVWGKPHTDLSTVIPRHQTEEIPAGTLDFEVLASPSESGDDFAPLLLDRPAQLKESVEPQWFSIMRPGLNAAALPFPDAVEMRRLLVRVLSTYGSPRERSQVDGFALGEVAAYGPDLEILVQHPQSAGGEDTSRFQFAPREVRALAGEPKFVFFINKTRTAVAHDVVTVNQQTNMEVKLAPGEAKAGQFVAGRPGRYEFYCKVVGHAELGLIGTITVR